MIVQVVAALALALALVPAALVFANLRLYRPPPRPGRGDVPYVSVLIPARDEEGAVGASVMSALASRGVELEVVVLDDRSADATAAEVSAIARRDPRVRLIRGQDPSPGWCGKPHACAQLAAAARYDLLAFLDADVRLAPDGLARMAAFLDASAADLASGVPRQETRGLVEALVVPLIHFILLGFLPLRRMRASGHVAYAAGCGQLFVTRRGAYERAGGHAAVRATWHDGLMLPRAYRAAGLRTDLFDATDVAHCRMYHSAREVWRGFAKNAHEALAAPRMIVPATLVLAGGQIVPVALLAGWVGLTPAARVLAALGTLAGYVPRLVMARRFSQPIVGALLHPLGVAVLLAIQWWAFARVVAGLPTAWKGRAYVRA